MKKVFFRIMLGVFIILICLFLVNEFIIKHHTDAKIVTMPQKVHAIETKYHLVSVPLSQISLFAQEAAISSQNERFYSDIGISLRGTLRAIAFSLISPKRQGASTITEQLAKVVYFQSKDTIQTDFLTKLYALYMTRMYPKKQILESYLNVIYFGRNAYGIDQASKTYFGSTPNNLTLSQSAYLLGLIDAPSYLSGHPHAAKKQASLVLQTMIRDRYITAGQARKSEQSLQAF